VRLSAYCEKIAATLENTANGGKGVDKITSPITYLGEGWNAWAVIEGVCTMPVDPALDERLIPEGGMTEGMLRADIGTINLECARGLPGSETLDVGRCVRWLDAAAAHVAEKTRELQPLFDRQPGRFDHSEVVFRVMVMVEALQLDLGVSYRADLIEADDHAFFSSAEHLFIHGPIQGKGGTCSSLPPLYVAVGRRLGYPLKLVRAKRHLFARWDDGEGRRFNLECTSRGFVSHPDDYYLRWPRPTTLEEVRRCGLLRSLLPEQEVAVFLCNRGRVWMEHGCYDEAVEAYQRACTFAPELPGCSSALNLATRLAGCCRE
jgi:hypothetical protein